MIPVTSPNKVYSKPTMRRRYEVWFLKLQLADGSGAWWIRYLLMNLGRDGGGGCPGNPCGMPAQIWATWFPKNGAPQGFIRGYSKDQLSLGDASGMPFDLQFHGNRITEGSCVGRLEAEGHLIEWDLRYRSTFGSTLSDKGWLGFSRTPHSDAVFSGKISFDGRTVSGETLGYGLQGHNCGFRHRHLWNWTHCLVLQEHGRGMSTFEALEYEMPFGLRFRRALLWHDGRLHIFPKFKQICRDRDNLQWVIECSSAKEQSSLVAVVDGSGPSARRVPYLRTDCRSTFDVANNSLAQSNLYFSHRGHPLEFLTANGGAVLEMVGD